MRPGNRVQGSDVVMHNINEFDSMRLSKIDLCKLVCSALKDIKCNRL